MQIIITGNIMKIKTLIVPVSISKRDINWLRNWNLKRVWLPTRLPNDTEIVVYRIVQELLTNVLKHSEASEVLIQLMRRDNLLLLMVEYKGRGFNADNILKNKGSGLNNIQSRVSYLNGTMDVKSEPGKGTSFHMEIPLL